MGKNRLWNKALILSICFHMGVIPCIGIFFNSYLTAPLVAKPIELELVMSVAAQPVNDGNPVEQPGKISRPPTPRPKIPDKTPPPLKTPPVNEQKPVPAVKDSAAVIDRIDKTINQNADSENSDKNPADSSAAQAAPAGSGQSNSSTNDAGGRPGKSGGYVRPQLLNKVEPVYPERARAAAREGTVSVSLEVLSNGKVGTVAIKQSSGHTDLDEAAVKAVKRWRFVPAKDSVSGRPITCLVNLPVVFQLK